MTEIQISDDFDPDKLAESGQCFRWRRRGQGGELRRALWPAPARRLSRGRVDPAGPGPRVPTGLAPGALPPLERYRPWNGVYQQYLFFYDRSQKQIEVNDP